MSINDATPADWDRVRKEHPAIIPCGPKSYIVTDEAMTAYHVIADEELEDVVNKPIHYNSGGIECIEAIKASMSIEAFEGYLKGNCLKYLWRMSYKGKALEDAKKAQWYLQKLIDSVEEIA